MIRKVEADLIESHDSVDAVEPVASKPVDKVNIYRIVIRGLAWTLTEWVFTDGAFALMSDYVTEPDEPPGRCGPVIAGSRGGALARLAAASRGQLIGEWALLVIDQTICRGYLDWGSWSCDMEVDA